MLHYKSLPFINPERVFAILANTPGVIFLDSSQEHRYYGRYSFIMLNPLKQFYAAHSIIFNDLHKWQDILHQNKAIHDTELPPFTGGLAGYFSYDLGKQLEIIPHAHVGNIDDYTIGLYNQVFAFDHMQDICYVMVNEIIGFDLDYDQQMDDMLAIYNSADELPNIPDLPKINLSSNFSKLEYMSKVQDAKERILDGDIFEINLSQRFSGTISDEYPLDLLYRKMRKINKAPFSAYLNLGDLKILSASPERFLSIKDRHIETRPIKGTCKRSSDPYEDKQFADNLRKSEKDRAENIMIVDLMRNDLAKICTPQSIKVSQLCGVESFTNIHHLVSVIEGELSPEKSIFDVIPACFPGGSITGAPKIRAMQIIEELEASPRGVYCGSIGYFGFNGSVDLSIAIRTLTAHNNQLSFQVGGAITLDSDPESEYNETLVKGQKILEAIN